jgi:beta-lactamase superfamily II metal-dependent hydrolase
MGFKQKNLTGGIAMANCKSDRKHKLARAILVIVALAVVTVIGTFLGLGDYSPGTEGTTLQQTTAPTNSTQNGTHISTPEGELILTMIDVGQADSFLLEQGGETALIDCGTRSTGKDVVQYLNDHGITHIDYIFGTHPHDDHMGGMYDVITSVDVGKVIIPEVEAGTSTANWYIKLMSELSTGSYEVQNPKVGDMYYLGDAEIEVIGQLSDADGNTNNYSTVMKVSFGKMDIVMTGDAETEVEKVILQSGQDISAEILKVGHHGSDTSTSNDFLDAVNPKYALISCKVGNKYEHPTKSTMDKLENRNIEVYRTDECGTVVLAITPTDVTFSSEPGDYLSGPELEEREGT